MKSVRVSLFYLTLIAFIPIMGSFFLVQQFGNEVWLNEPLHSSLEAAGAMVAILSGWLMLIQWRHEKTYAAVPWIASSLFAMGCLDAFHAFLHVSAAFFWTRGFATFFGGLLFTLVWLPERYSRTSLARNLPFGTVIFAGLLGFVLFLWPELMPRQFQTDGRFSLMAQLVNVVGGIGYLIACFRFISGIQRGEKNQSENLIFAAQCAMLGIAGLLFAVSNMWVPVWWLFHVLRFLSYLVVLRYVFNAFIQIQNQLSLSNLELQKRNAALATSNHELEAFCYSVSHDLRAPLRGIDGFSQALLEDYAAVLNTQAKSYLDFIRSGVQNMGQLIDDLLKLSRLTRADVHVADVDVSSQVHLIEQQLRRLAPQRNVEFLIEEKLHVQADAGMLAIALENLVNNAWKFTSGKALARIEFGAVEEHDRRVFFIRDNGAGFDMAYSEKLFGAFQRLHTHAEFPGTGVGLATVRRILSRHGGQVWAKGQVGVGSTFYFSLP